MMRYATDRTDANRSAGTAVVIIAFNHPSARNIQPRNDITIGACGADIPPNNRPTNRIRKHDISASSVSVRPNGLTCSGGNETEKSRWNSHVECVGLTRTK